MLNIIFLLVAGSVLAYISNNNLEPVSVNLGTYVFANVPLFYVIVGSTLIGLGVSYVFQLLSNISNAFALRSKRIEISHSRDQVAGLTKRVHQLELENEKLKKDSAMPHDANAL